MSATTAFRTRAHRERPRPARTRSTRTTPTAVATSATATSGMDERTGDGSTRRTAIVSSDLDDLSGSALPDDGPQGAADVVHVAPVADAAMDVPGDAAREREVEEQPPVVGRDGGGQGQTHAEAAGNDRPPPGTADGGDEEDGRRRQKSTAVERADAVEERAGAETPDHGGERGRRDRWTSPPENAPHGSTSRSAWPTVTARRPASASLRRRRR